MNKSRIMIFFGIMASIILIGAFTISGCNPPEDSSDFEGNAAADPKTPPSSSAGKCTNLVDDDLDGFADRWGVPAHCSINAPIRTTSLGSVATFTAVGEYVNSTPDTYTCVVTTAGGSGVAQIQCASALLDTGNAITVPAVVNVDIPMIVGTQGLVLYFTDINGTLNLVAGETWSVGVKSFNANCERRPDLSCMHPESTGEYICDNGIDDDFDTLVDDYDLDCYINCSCNYYLPTWVSEAGQFTPQCNDGIDNDGDTLIDFPADGLCSDDCDNDEDN